MLRNESSSRVQGLLFTNHPQPLDISIHTGAQKRRLAGAEGQGERNTPYTGECHRCHFLPFVLTSARAGRSSSFPEQVAVVGHTSTSEQSARGNSVNIRSLTDGSMRDSATH